MKSYEFNMTNRHITILGLIQGLILGAGMLLTGALCKVGQVAVDANAQLCGVAAPRAFLTAIHFRDYGYLFGFLVLVWVIWAVRADAGYVFKYLPNRFIFVSGLALAIFFAFLSVSCCIGALTACF